MCFKHSRTEDMVNAFGEVWYGWCKKWQIIEPILIKVFSRLPLTSTFTQWGAKWRYYSVKFYGRTLIELLKRFAHQAHTLGSSYAISYSTSHQLFKIFYICQQQCHFPPQTDNKDILFPQTRNWMKMKCVCVCVQFGGYSFQKLNQLNESFHRSECVFKLS